MATDDIGALPSKKWANFELSFNIWAKNGKLVQYKYVREFEAFINEEKILYEWWNLLHI